MSLLPACMMPDGGDACVAYHEAVTEAHALRAALSQVTDALKHLSERPVTYNGNCIVIECVSHGQAMSVMRLARSALSATKEPGDA